MKSSSSSPWIVRYVRVRPQLLPLFRSAATVAFCLIFVSSISGMIVVPIFLMLYKPRHPAGHILLHLRDSLGAHLFVFILFIAAISITALCMSIQLSWLRLQHEPVA
jgi:hypothetical protein